MYFKPANPFSSSNSHFKHVSQVVVTERLSKGVVRPSPFKLGYEKKLHQLRCLVSRKMQSVWFRPIYSQEHKYEYTGFLSM